MQPIGSKAMLSLSYLVVGTGKVLTFTEYREHDEGISMTQETIVGIADYVMDEVSARWKVLAADGFKMIGVKAVYMKGDVYADGFSTLPSVAGDISAPLADGHNMMGDEVSLVIQRVTGKRGRRYRGRMFIPGIAESVNSNGYLNADYETQADSLAAWLGADVTIGGASPAAGTIWHARLYSIGPRDPESHLPTGAADFVPVSDCRYVNKLATRKDREIRGAVYAR